MSDIFFQFGILISKRRLSFLGLILFLCSLSLWTIVQRVQNEIPIDFTPQAIFMDQSPEMLRLREIEKTFGLRGNIVRHRVEQDADLFGG